jgi:hypothetical protein
MVLVLAKILSIVRAALSEIADTPAFKKVHRCFFCQQPAVDLPLIPVCANCQSRPPPTQADPCRLIPSSSIDEISFAIANATQDLPDSSATHSHSYYHSV